MANSQAHYTALSNFRYVIRASSTKTPSQGTRRLFHVIPAFILTIPSRRAVAPVCTVGVSPYRDLAASLYTTVLFWEGRESSWCERLCFEVSLIWLRGDGTGSFRMTQEVLFSLNCFKGQFTSFTFKLLLLQEPYSTHAVAQVFLGLCYP